MPSARVAIGLVCLAGCDQLFGVDRVGESMAAEPAVSVPRLFPPAAAPKAYLYEGTGMRPLSGVHQPVPIVVTDLLAADTVALTLPDGLGTDWLLCGASVGPGAHDLSTLVAPPCERGSSVLAFTLAVPLSTDAGENASISPATVTVHRGDSSFELPIAIIGLDEVELTTPGNGLYSRIRIGAYTPVKGGPAVELRATSDVEIVGVLDARGSDPGTSGSTLGGPGNFNAGAVSSCGNQVACDAAGDPGGRGGTRCQLAMCTMVTTRAASGGGGGGAVAGSDGSTPTGSCAATGTSAGGQPVAGRFLAVLDGAGGGGGGAGGRLILNDSATNLSGRSGGGGGGVVAIDTLGELRFSTGTILASGGTGQSIGNVACGPGPIHFAAPGGGGGGGAVRLRAERYMAGTDWSRIDVRGGTAGRYSTSIAATGDGAVGKLRIDGLDGNIALTTGVVRGPDFDLPAPIVSTAELEIAARAHSAAALYWSVRPAADETAEINMEPATSSTLVAPLAPGLNEFCVYVEPITTAHSADEAAALARCTWIARVM